MSSYSISCSKNFPTLFENGLKFLKSFVIMFSFFIQINVSNPNDIIDLCFAQVEVVGWPGEGWDNV